MTLSIIGVLTALGLAALRHAQDSAKRVTTISNLRTIGAASLSYAADNDGRLPVNDPGNVMDQTISYGLISRSSPRKLFTTNVNPLGQGPADYLTSVDVFYSGFVERHRNRPAGEFYAVGSGYEISFHFYYLTPDPDESPVLPDAFNARLTDNPKCPIYGDVGIYNPAFGFTDKVHHLLYLDGSVQAFSTDEIDLPSWRERFKVFMGVE